MKRLFLLGVFVTAIVGTAQAVEPPDVMNYQGVLRDDADKPVDGTVSMVFRLFSADAGGDEILVDTHASVTVSDGLFSVGIGGYVQGGTGVVTDGSGPGRYVYLPVVFADYPDVYLEVEVQGEVLAPRTRIVSAPQALNARFVNGVRVARSSARNLFVDAVIGDDDNNNGLSPATPKRTIQAALGMVPMILGGDVTIYIADGTYNESLFIDRRLRTGGYFVKLIGNVAAPQNVVLDGQGVLDDAILSLDLIEVRGITAMNYVEQGVEAYNSLLWLSDCIITGNGAGGNAAIEANNGASIDITNCLIAGNLAGGVDAAGSKISIGGCQISDNGGYGIRASESSKIGFSEAGGLTITGNGAVGARAGYNSVIHFNSRGDLTITGNAGGDLAAEFHSTITGYSNGSAGTCNADPHSVCVP